MTNAVDRYAHIDALRAVAVLVVVLYHAGVPRMPGDTGVTAFFVISGFIITHLLLRERERTGGFAVGSFYLRRALKLAPAFLVFVLIPTIVWAILRGVDWFVVSSQVLFTYNWVEVFLPELAGHVLPGSRVTWSLGVEEQFYILLALTWLLLVRTRWWRAALLAISISAIVVSAVLRIHYADATQNTHVLRGSDTRMDAIAFGILVALLFQAWRTGRARWATAVGNPWLAAGVVVVFAATLMTADAEFKLTWRYTIQSICVALIIAAGLIAERGLLLGLVRRVSASRIVTLIGLASYSIYLGHNAMTRLLLSWFPDSPTIVTWVLYPALTVGAGIVVYLAVEVPVRRFRDRKPARRDLVAAGV